MSIIARHITIDMYKCKIDNLSNPSALAQELQEILTNGKWDILSSTYHSFPDGHVAVLLLFADGHFTVHVFPELQYISCDAFICHANATPETLFTIFRKFFKPEKTKTTILKRGDFGSISDMKPTYRTRVAHLRKIHNTGSKMIKMLSPKKKS